MLAEVDAHVLNRADIAAVLGLSVSMLNTVVSKLPEIEKSCLCCGPSFSQEC